MLSTLLTASVALSVALSPQEPTGTDSGIVRSAPVDPLTEPPCSYIVQQHAKGMVRDDDPVIAWIRGKHNGGAAPLRHFLSGPRVVNDTYGLFFYDPDGGYVAAYEKAYGYRQYGWRNGVLVVAHEDGTLFSALSGRGIEGPRKGEVLNRVPSLTTSWGYWLLLHPESTAYDLFDGGRYPVVDLPTAPTPASLQSRAAAIDQRLPAETGVIGLQVGDEQLAVSLAGLEDRDVVHAELGGQRVVVFWYGATRTAVAFLARHDDRDLEFAVDRIAPIVAPFRDVQTKTRWSPAGRGIDGSLRGAELQWVDSIQCKWFAWAAEFPETQVHGQPAVEEDRKDGPGKASVVNAAQVDGAFLRGARERGETVVVALDDAVPSAAEVAAATAVRDGGLPLGYWIEVGRSERLANEHPEWVATIDGHHEWRTAGRADRDTERPDEDRVVTAWPWVPVRYREAFDAHLQRVREQLEALPAPEVVYLNDLQGPPNACGCGNELCRWATDYTLGGRKPGRVAELLGPDAAARFVAEVHRLVPDARVVPVWVTECEEADAAGACHGVGCYGGACWKRFDAQWRALREVADEVVLLVPAPLFDRELPRYAPWKGWAGFALTHLRTRFAGERTPRLGAAVQGFDGADIAAQVASAGDAQASTILVLRAPMRQGWEPRTRARLP